MHAYSIIALFCIHIPDQNNYIGDSQSNNSDSLNNKNDYDIITINHDKNSNYTATNIDKNY